MGNISRQADVTQPSATSNTQHYQTLYVQDYGTGGYVPGTGGNDTAALQATIDAAKALSGRIDIRCPPTLRLNSAPQVTNKGNAVVMLPAPTDATCVLNFVAAEGGTTITTTLTGQSYSATYGTPSLIGGPTIEQTGAGASIQFWSGLVEFSGQFFWTFPANPTISGLDLSGIGRVSIDYMEFRGGGAGATQPTNAWTYGLRLPEGTNSAEVYLGYIYCAWLYVGVVANSAHVNARSIRGFQCALPLAFTGSQQFGANDGHSSLIHYYGTEKCTYHLASWDPVGGIISLPSSKPVQVVINLWDIEDGQAANWWTTTTHLLDANSQFYGRINYGRVVAVTGRVSGFLTNSGGQNVSLIDITTVATKTLGLVAQTALAGYTLVNGTGAVLTWTAPNDGQLHFVEVNSIKITTSTETGGQINVSGTTGGVAWSKTLIGGAQTGSTQAPGNTSMTVAVDPNTAVSVTATALTAGASKLFAGMLAV